MFDTRLQVVNSFTADAESFAELPSPKLGTSEVGRRRSQSVYWEYLMFGMP